MDLFEYHSLNNDIKPNNLFDKKYFIIYLKI